MKRGGPLPPKRAKPRRNEGRVQHNRIRDLTDAQEVWEAAHVRLVRETGCCMTAYSGEIHHLMLAPGKRTRRDDRFIVCLRAEYHRGAEGVHGLGSEAAFKARWGIDLLEEAQRLFALSEATLGPYPPDEGATPPPPP